MGLSDFCFHAGPLIRKEKGYQYMLREQRAAIFSRMMLFTRQVKFKHHCLVVDKKFVDSSQQIIEKLRRQLEVFLASSVFLPYGNHNIEIYYDCGQAPITGILRASFSSWFGERVEFVKDVKPERYKLFQLADMICSIKLIESKLAVGMPLTQNEIRLFGGSRKFKHNILRSIKMKEI